MSSSYGLAGPERHGHGSDPRVSDVSLERLFRQDYAKLVRAAWMMGGSREVAEDVVQDVFARMLATRHLMVADDPESYLYRAVVNRLRSWQRRQSLERRHSLVDYTASVAPPEVSDVSEFLTALSERQRTAIVLRYFCDLPLADVADVMGCRRGTVTVLIRRALAKARKMKEVFEP
jgi:RNA polymerase sigma factor (sigma-70 family)